MHTLESDVKISIELLEDLNTLDLMDLCDATEATMKESKNFNIGSRKWNNAIRETFESYFKGIMLIPERKIIVGRIDSTISSSLQILEPHPSNETSNFIISIENVFVAPWARKIGMAKRMMLFAEKYAKEGGYKAIKSSIPSTKKSAMRLYQACGYREWGIMEQYELVDNNIVSGHFYSKSI
ncbi:MAG: GNAT family N-acetyltransferase [Alphaproteobacteria bacterium]|nr:GNAT family N-acetyltransferase [Alphaproteobacteria bacterium]